MTFIIEVLNYNKKKKQFTVYTYTHILYTCTNNLFSWIISLEFVDIIANMHTWNIYLHQFWTEPRDHTFKLKIIYSTGFILLYGY